MGHLGRLSRGADFLSKGDYIPNPDSGKGRYQVYHVLQGGMGVIYIVYDTEWREPFAIKSYRENLQSESAQGQFRKEAKTWIDLERHENMARARILPFTTKKFFKK